jgi:hypothetical protein
VNENILMLKNNRCGADEKHHYCKNNKGRITSGRNQRVKYCGEFKWKLKLAELT